MRWEQTWDRPSALSSPGGRAGLWETGRASDDESRQLRVHSKRIHNGIQPLFLCGPGGIVEVLIKPEKPLVRRAGVQLLEGKKKKGVDLPWCPWESEQLTHLRGTSGFPLRLLLD